MATIRRNEDEEKQQEQQVRASAVPAAPVTIEHPDYGSLAGRVTDVISAGKSGGTAKKAYKPDYDSFARNHDAHVLSSSRAALSTMPQAQRALDHATDRAGKTIGYDVSEQETALYKALRATGITQTAAGNPNLYEANIDTLWRSMRAIPDKKRRETAYNTLKALTKTKGSRFYKTSLPTTEADRSYIDTLDMPKAAYDEWADAVSGQFYSDSAHEAENRQAYAQLYEAAVAGAGNDTQKYWRVQALDDAYELATGRRTPRGEAAAGTLAPATQAQDEEEAEKKPGFWQRMVDAITSPTVTPALPVPAPASEKQGPVQQDVPSAQTAEVQGPVQQGRSGQAQNTVPAAGTIDLAGDAERAFVEYALTGRGNELDEATREAVNALTDSSRTARALLGLDATDSAALYDKAQESPFALAQANAQRFSYYYEGSSMTLGATLSGLLARVEQSDFPQEMRDDARGAILQLGLAAEEAERNGELPGEGNLYERYISAHPQALEPVSSVFSAVDELEQESIAREKESEEQEALTAKQRLELAQAHMRSGDYTQEDRALVLESAPVIIARDAAKDETYRALAASIDEAMTESLRAEGGWFNRQTERYLAAQGLPMSTESMEARDYKRILAGYASDEVLADVRVAHALGYDSLAAYYADVGTPTVEALCARASLTMERVGGSMTDADMETALSIADDPLGETQSAQDSSYGEAALRGVQSGAATAGADVLSAYLTARQISEADSRTLEAQTRKEYAEEYGAALSAYMARAKWEAAIRSDALPNEEWAQYARDYLNAGGDPFKLGPAPEVGLARTTQKAWLETARQNAEYAAQHMTGGQQTVYGVASSSGYNLTLQTMSTGLSLLMGSPAAGMALSFGAASYAQETRGQLAKGPGARTLSEVNAIGLAHAASDTIANTATSAAFEGKLLRAAGIAPSISLGAAQAGEAGTAKTMSAMLKAFGKGFAKGAADMAADEVFKDEFKERWLWSVIGTGANAAADIVEAAGKALWQAANPFDDVQDVLAAAPEGFVSMLPMIFLGGVGDGVSAVRTAFPKTVRAAQQVAQSGEAQDARDFVDALDAEISAPGAKEELNAAMQAQAAGLHAAAELVVSPDMQARSAQAQKTAEQAQAHRETAQAETERAAQAQAAMMAAQENGDVDGELAAADEYMKAVHNAHEAAGEAQQKTLEADRQAEEIVSEAIARGQERAKTELAETARLMAGMAERFMEQEDSLLERQVRRRMDYLMDRANAAMQKEDMDTANELLTQYGALSMMLDDQTHARESETPAEREAFLQQARDFYEDMIAARADEKSQRMGRWQTALERAQGEVDTLAQEARDMGSIYRELRGRKIFVSDAQARELLAVTGLKRISNFNAQYGTRLTRSERDLETKEAGRGKPPVRLDDWLTDIQAEHPGALSGQWDGHPEEALLALAQRAQTMKQRTQAARDRLASTQKAYVERAAQTERDMAREQVQVPPGEALNQYANETYPQAEDAVEEVASAIRGTSHTVHTQEAMRTQAEERVAREGLKATVEALLKAERYTDADVYAAHLCQRILKQRGDKPLHAALTIKLDSQLSQTGQTLRAQQEQRKRTAAGAVADTVEQADAYNRRHNRGALTYDTQAALDGLDSAQLAVGSTDAQPFMDSQVSRGTSDPVMQKLASDVAMRSGGALKVYWADMEDVRGFFDRERGLIVLSQRAGAGEAAAMAALHEYTHYMETQPGYKAYAEAMLRAAYGEDWQKSSAYRIDSGLVRDSYADAGQTLEDADLQKELVAQAAEKIITGDEAFQRAMFGTKDGAAVRVLAGLDHFLAKDRAKREGKEAENRYALLRQGRDAIRRAIQGKAQGAGEAHSGGVQYALGWTKDGERVVRIEEDILDGVPQKDWAKTVKAALKEKYPNGITVGNNLIQITGKSRNEIVNAKDSKWLKNNQPDVYADKLRAANNAGEIVEASSGYVNEGNFHERKDNIAEFARGRVNIEVGGQMYNAEVVIGTRKNGEMLLYDFVRMTKKEMQRTAARRSAAHDSRAASLSDKSVAQGTPDVNTQSMPDSVQYAIKTETDTGAASGRLTGDRQQRITEAETADAITAAEPGDYIELREQPDAEQTDFEAQMRLSAAEQTRRATANIEAMEAAESDVSDDNPWRLPINSFQRGLIKRFGLDNEKLPGVSYNRATVRQRALCAILACPQDDLGAGRLTLTQQLEYLSKGRLSLRDRSRTLTEQVRDILSGRVAVVTEADLNYILSQAAIVEACTEFDREGVPSDREGQIAYRRMLEAQANTQPQGLLTMYNALRYINMLSGPATAIRNVVGNTLMYGADNMGKAAFGQWIDAAVSHVTGTRTISGVTREERRAGVDAGRVALRNAFDDAFVAKADTNSESRYDVGDSKGRVFQNNALEAARTIVGFAMEGDDRRRIAQAIEEEAAAIRRIGMKVRDETAPIGERRLRAMTDEEIMAEARSRAMERFFHNQNALSKWMGGEKANGIGATLLRFIIPFVKTPTNVALRMLDFSPLGLAKAAMWDGLAMGAAGRFDQRAFVMGMTRGLTGSAVTALGACLYAAGVLKPGYGEEKDKKRRDMLREQGVPYGSYIELFGQMHELSFAMPVMAGLEIGMQMVNGWENEEDALGIIRQMVGSSINQLFENSYLQTLANMTTRNGGEGVDALMNAAGAVIESALTQTFSPSWLRAIAKAYDPYVRDTTDSNIIMATIKKTVIQNWPGLRQTLPAVSGVTGEGMTQGKAYQPGSRWESGVAAFVDAMMTPTATYEKRDDAALCELLDLSYRADAQGIKHATSFLPEKELISSKENSLTVNKTLAQKLGESDSFVLELDDSERRYANALYSRILFGGTGTTQYLNRNGNPYRIEGIRAYMSSRAYALASDEQRISDIEDMKDLAKELTLSEIMRGQR